MTGPSPFGLQLRAHIRARGMKDADVARRLGVDASTVSRWCGRTRPQQADLERLMGDLSLSDGQRTVLHALWVQAGRR